MLLLPVLVLARLATALVTLQTIRDITNCTKDCTAEIMGAGLAQLATEVGVGQVPVLELRNDDDEDEMENVIAAALAMVDGKILEALNVPLDTEIEPPGSKSECPSIEAEYHAFVGATARFLHTIQERQMAHRWDGESLVFHKLAYMQALWASPRKNEQHKSFIEQQVTLYESTGCFGKTKEVLRRGVEIVEYMNDMIDTFGGYFLMQPE